ncbi:hypothetical protein EDD18DRAFT_1355429 [Armillaria luteobubalina]|uniref:DUF5648 domain-containing protein n=1 Tax=Armillaria luteobubalina TaxID=153913 RepID=A0AA39Q2Y7_9AGAR|nr:hypothetical protein EDD18DRAFT_1355429 [Armillaria luteobubalina]
MFSAKTSDIEYLLTVYTTMKAILSLFVVTLLSLSAKAASVSIAPEARAADACPDPYTGVPLLRARRLDGAGTRYYDTNATYMNELAHTIWQPEGTAGIVFKKAALHTVPLYAFYHDTAVNTPKDWYCTTSESDKATWAKNKNYVYRGVWAYMFSNDGCGGVPFYTLWDPSRQVHLFTADQNERKSATSVNGGYIEMGIAGYILPL